MIDLPAIPDLHDPALAAAVQSDLDDQTKPPGSLGRLEALALQIACVQGRRRPRLHAPQLVVFAADHGLASRGVSAYPRDVTRQMVANFLRGGAAVSVLARQHGLALTVADCGVHGATASTTTGTDSNGNGNGNGNEDRNDAFRGDAPGLHPRLAILRVPGAEDGCADSSAGPAMTPEQCRAALTHGRELVARLPGNVLLLGEMGIGNSSAAALLMSRLTGLPLAQCTGRGTGLDDAGLQRKLAVLQQVLDRHAGARGPLGLLAAMGGLEIAAMTGAALQAAAERRLIVVDGFITTAAVAVAAELAPAVLQRCVFSHQSAESGHGRWLRHLGVEPLLALGLRLGEGSGAALAWPLLVSSLCLLDEMASFAAAGVSGAIAPTVG